MNNNKISIVLNEENNGMGSDYIKELQNSMLENIIAAKPIHVSSLNLKRQLVRIIKKLPSSLKPNKLCMPSRWRSGKTIVTICGGDVAYCLPAFLISDQNFLYVWDVWPSAMNKMLEITRMLNVEKIFFSSQKSCEIFEKLSKGSPKCVWIPEGIRPNDYSYVPYSSKNIDVIEFGRRYDKFHDSIASRLAIEGVSHLFSDGCINKLQTKRDLCDSLARSKISICFPSEITHPERSQGISTMTLRYLQSMISKCLIVGAMPDEMKTLFTYTPIIEINNNNPADQIINILRNYNQYLPLIERNYENVIKNHLWSNRIEVIKMHLQI